MAASKYKGKTFIALTRLNPFMTNEVWETGAELKRDVELKDFDDARIEKNIEVGNMQVKGADNG